jgi:glycosyltransferase involved in cell wall biosynthesis
MLKISSIVIAKDEEANIKRCIESQLSCIDEIIVLVDSCSSDKTLDIVKSFPQIKYEVVKWMGFSETKQYGISLVSNNWVLWVDADESITSSLSDEINKFKLLQPKFDAYSVPRKAYFLGRWIEHSGWYPGRVTRLFNKNKAKFSDKGVHEGLIINGTTGQLVCDLDHYTDPSIKHYFEKFNRYTSLAAEELAKESKHFSIADILFRPAFIFFKMYILKRGFLDGIQGFVLAVFSAAYVFTKYCKFWEIKKQG